MSFDPRLEQRFAEVIQPAIESLGMKDERITAHRVDFTTVSDSILTEVIEGITTDVLVFIDVTSIGSFADRPVRNDNVMYELGLAHAIRRPEEVLIFRSDDDPLPFDLTGLRVHQYDPEGDPVSATAKLRSVLLNAATTITRLDSLYIDQAARELDWISITVMLRLAGFNQLFPTLADLDSLKTDLSFQPTFQHLLRLGIIETEFPRIMGVAAGNPTTARPEDMGKYRLSRLGKNVLARILERTGIWEAFAQQNTEMRQLLENFLRNYR
jgi:hypothetical protein